MADALIQKPRRKGGRPTRTFEQYRDVFIDRMSAPEFAAAAGISPTTARKILSDAAEAGIIHVSAERKAVTHLVKLYSLGPEQEPKHRTAVGETDRDSGLVKLRELARQGPVNPYVQLEWAGARQ